ncbi:hypothetical protein BIY37_08070 [Candidatus Brocadia sapporoensis]|uniref:Uncharacterized protein n=1 Tax=Candidatus Brocadia sapporoensis TaxID=392547 RepID=A0A1V6LZD1_9BACT|nr:hypothetical protein [Candidatus Brocadia sp.]OQD45475.1 hypothetical protein BIY37_08070 [Candidatus Brocadia sapporoensis]
MSTAPLVFHKKNMGRVDGGITPAIPHRTVHAELLHTALQTDSLSRRAYPTVTFHNAGFFGKGRLFSSTWKSFQLKTFLWLRLFSHLYHKPSDGIAKFGQRQTVSCKAAAVVISLQG